MTLTELIEEVSERYDPDFLVEILDLSTRQIAEAFAEELLNKKADLIDNYERS